MESKNLAIEDIHVGDSISFSRTWKEEDIISFAKLSGDSNPLHMDSVYAEKTQFKRKLVHGMLVASLCSTFVGMYIPGRKCLYLSQKLSFKKPVFIGDTVVVTGIVTAISIATRVVSITISIKKEVDEVLIGEARVQVL